MSRRQGSNYLVPVYTWYVYICTYMNSRQGIHHYVLIWLQATFCVPFRRSKTTPSPKTVQFFFDFKRDFSQRRNWHFNFSFEQSLFLLVACWSLCDRNRSINKGDTFWIFQNGVMWTTGTRICEGLYQLHAIAVHLRSVALVIKVVADTLSLFRRDNPEEHEWSKRAQSQLLNDWA